MPRPSARARDHLALAVRREVERDPERVRTRLIACGRPPWASAVDVEVRYGGLAWPRGGDDDELGIAYEAPADDADDPRALDVSSVRIGALGVVPLYVDEAGVITGHWRASSIDVLVERLALEAPGPWPGYIAVELQPAAGPRLADALDLPQVVEASDRFEAWWASDALRLRHRLPDATVPDALDVTYDRAMAGSVAAAARVIEAALALDPATGFAVYPWLRPTPAGPPVAPLPATAVRCRARARDVLAARDTGWVEVRHDAGVWQIEITRGDVPWLRLTEAGVDVATEPRAGAAPAPPARP